MGRFYDGPGDEFWMNRSVNALLGHLGDLEGSGRKIPRPGMFGDVLTASDKSLVESCQ